VARGGRGRTKLAVRNTDRAVGTRLAGEVAARYGDHGFPGELELELTGTAGQSLGAFLVSGIAIRLAGFANDYVGKGMAGGLIVVRPPAELGAGPDQASALAGNTVLYGATGGALFVAGTAGQRFAVRNSGARAVVEGVGDHGCEYMTGGLVAVLGPVGRNFAAGMTGGEAWVLDADGSLGSKLNGETVEVHALEPGEDATALQGLLMEHLLRTGSPRAASVLGDWDAWRPRFRRIRPKAALPLPRHFCPDGP
jgi:glutamate synthase domain-containing protein 3